MKGLLLAILLFLLFTGLIITDALLVERAVSDMETTLAAVSADESGAEKIKEMKNTLEESRFLFSISLPLSYIEEAEEKVLALELVAKKGLETETQKEKEALALCLSKIRKGVLPTLDILF